MAMRKMGGKKQAHPAGKKPALLSVFQDNLESERCSKLLSALAGPDRLRIVECLQSQPMNVSQIVQVIGVPLANVSHHLQQLKSAGLVESERKGRFILYRLSPTYLRETSGTPPALDFGCCRLELGGKHNTRHDRFLS